MSFFFGIFLGLLIAATLVAIVVGVNPRVEDSYIQTTTLLFVDVQTVNKDQMYPSGVSVVVVEVPAGKTINDCVTRIDL